MPTSDVAVLHHAVVDIEVRSLAADLAVPHSPTSRSLADGPASELWSEFEGCVQGWRRNWTSNGVTDTAFFFKPVAAAIKQAA